MSFDYQRPTPISFREGRQAMSTAIARASQNKLNMQLKLMEQQRAAQAKAVKDQTTEIKRRQGVIDGFDFTNMTLDGRNNLMASLEYLQDNMGNMNSQQFGAYVRQLKSNIAQDQQWYKGASSVFNDSVEMMDPVAREKENNKLEGYEITADTEQHRMKSILLEPPISARQGFEGRYDPATLSYVTPQGSIPITNGLYTPSESLGPTMKKLIQYSNLTEVYNAQKRGSAKTYSDRMSSAKTEERDPSYYDQSALAAYHDVVWNNRNNRRSLITQYETEENAISSDAREVVLSSNSKIKALELANTAGISPEEVQQINDLYDFGLEKTKEWGMQDWKPFKESGGSGSGDSDGMRRPKIEQGRVLDFSTFSAAQGVQVDEEDYFGIAEKGFLAFDTPQKINNTLRNFSGLDESDKQLDLYSFAMDRKFRLFLSLGVPTEVTTYKVFDREYATREDALRDPSAAAAPSLIREDKSTKVIPRNVIIRPAALINYDNQFVADEYKTSMSKEDDMYKNVLMQIAYQQTTSKKQAELGEERLMKLAFKYLRDQYEI